MASWQGYSSPTWSGDTLVVGFRDDLWIDWDGSGITEAAQVRERIRRPDFGHLEIEVTVDDPKAYTKPWTVTLRQLANLRSVPRLFDVRSGRRIQTIRSATVHYPL